LLCAGFNTLLSRNDTSALNLSRIGYLPVIDGSPAQYTTVYTVFVKSLEIAAKVNLEYVVLVFDEAIYAKAQQIRWKNESFMVKTILRLGDFHAVMSFRGAISRIFQDTSLRYVYCKLMHVYPFNTSMLLFFIRMYLQNLVLWDNILLMEL
jgi:hypothetical protein